MKECISDHPVVMNSLVENWADIHVDLQFRQNMTVIAGDSGSGKTFLCRRILHDLKFKYPCIHLFDYSDIPNAAAVANSISSTSGGLFVIDNADILITPEIAQAIYKTYTVNQFIVLGRLPANLCITADIYTELLYDNKTRTFSLRYMN